MKPQSDASDGELLQSMLAGDEEALGELYCRHHTTIYRFALQMSGSRALAEDVTQEVFMALMRDGKSYDSGRGALNWFMLGMARNLMRQRVGREHFYVPLNDDASNQSFAHELQTVRDPLDELSRSETIEAMRKAVLSLPPRYREVVVLCELHELSYAQAAGVLNCAVGTVRSRLHRARALLIEKMRPAQAEKITAEGVTPARCFV